MMKLRRKLAALDDFAKIETFLGQGYKLAAESDFSIEVVESITSFENHSLKNSCSNETENNPNIKGVGLVKLSLLFNGFFNIKKSLSENKLLQFLIGLLLCICVFVYLYSESWSTFYCTKETVCSDYLR